MPVEQVEATPLEANTEDVRAVSRMTESGEEVPHLSETLILPSMAIRVLPLPVLIIQNRALSFISDHAISSNFENDYTVLNTAAKGAKGLFYILDNQI